MHAHKSACEILTRALAHACACARVNILLYNYTLVGLLSKKHAEVSALVAKIFFRKKLVDISKQIIHLALLVDEMLITTDFVEKKSVGGLESA